MTRLTDRELATVLAALRYWQQDLIVNSDEGDGEPIDERLDGLTPLSSEEIDALCERLNSLTDTPDCESTDGRCDCELPGMFCSGVPGILACLKNGRLTPGARVERCDACERYPSDQAALQKLIELGIAAPASDAFID